MRSDPCACPIGLAQNIYVDMLMNAAPHILVIDSDAGTLRRCELFMSSYKVTTCDDKSAIDVFRTSKPDIVLTEVVMARCCGLELLRDIKRISPGTKVIAMSGGSSHLPADYVLYLAHRLGADGVLSKPVDAGQLVKTIDAALQSLRDGQAGSISGGWMRFKWCKHWEIE